MTVINLTSFFRENKLGELFMCCDDYQALKDCHEKITMVTEEIEGHRRHVRLTLHQPALEFTTVNGTEVLQIDSCLLIEQMSTGL